MASAVAGLTLAPGVDLSAKAIAATRSDSPRPPTFSSSSAAWKDRKRGRAAGSLVSSVLPAFPRPRPRPPLPPRPPGLRGLGFVFAFVPRAVSTNSRTSCGTSMRRVRTSSVDRFSRFSAASAVARSAVTFSDTLSSTRSSFSRVARVTSGRYIAVGFTSHVATTPFSTSVFRMSRPRSDPSIRTACAGYPGKDLALTTSLSPSLACAGSCARTMSISKSWSGQSLSSPGC